MKNNIKIYIGVIFYAVIGITFMALGLLNIVFLFLLFLGAIVIAYQAGVNVNVKTEKNRSMHYVFFFSIWFIVLGVCSLYYDVSHALRFDNSITYSDIVGAIGDAEIFIGVPIILFVMFIDALVTIKDKSIKTGISVSTFVLSTITVIVFIVEMFYLVARNIPSV